MGETLSFKYGKKVLPVILLLDASGSMSDNGKIGTLNEAVREMLQSFAEASTNNVDIHVAVVKFGGDAQIAMPLGAASTLSENYGDLRAGGMTPLGKALTLAKQNIIERKDVIPSAGTYRPMVVLVSDGMPNDEWHAPLDSFVKQGRSSKCTRMAMGIRVPKGTPAYSVLEEFVSDKEFVFSADQADQIKNFFKFVTISTIAMTGASSANAASSVRAVIDADDDDDDDDDLF